MTPVRAEAVKNIKNAAVKINRMIGAVTSKIASVSRCFAAGAKVIRRHVCGSGQMGA